MRFLSVGAAIVISVSVLSAQVPQAPTQQPVFRAGVELVSVDVTALDSNGRQVTDLSASDFQVEIDGATRQVVSAEYVRSVDPLRVIGAPRKVVVPDQTYFTSNAKGAPSGRLVMLLVDQGNIRSGAARAVMNSAKRFVDTLTPEDRVAVVAIPGPGELTDFTTDHDKVRESCCASSAPPAPHAVASIWPTCWAGGPPTRPRCSRRTWTPTRPISRRNWRRSSALTSAT